MLSDRQLRILQILVDDFISTGNPVGSRSLSKNVDISYSPATIRNEMADLEELGFIEKTHTSSGRVPSVKGYRYYVDHLLSPSELQQEEIHKLCSIFERKFLQWEQIVEKSANLLSELTNYTVIALGSSVFSNSLYKLQAIAVDEKTILAIIITNTGHVEHHMIKLPDGLDVKHAELIFQVLDKELKGVSLLELNKRLSGVFLKMFGYNAEVYEEFLVSIEKSVNFGLDNKWYYGGKNNIFSQPEFYNLEKVKMLLQAIEEKKMHDLISSNPVGISIKIGPENEWEELNDCSVITATCLVDSVNHGTIAIIGPTRMKYSKVISLLSYMTEQINFLGKY